MSVRRSLPWLLLGSVIRSRVAAFGTNESLNRAEHAIRVLTSQNGERCWQRLRGLIEMAIIPQEQWRIPATALDIGTDHGLLAIALATTGSFHVLGVDVSESALENGAYRLHQKVQKYTPLPVSFRQANGLRTGQPADFVFIAGMGVSTMIDILSATEDSLLLDSIGAKHLLLQPTNSKPSNLIKLYDHLQTNMKWTLVNERMEYVANRWYMSLHCSRPTNPEEAQVPFLWPGMKILNQQVFRDYVKHHAFWLQQDVAARRAAGIEDASGMNQLERWLYLVSSGSGLPQ
jgi:tRNA A22 N-methylase